MRQHQHGPRLTRMTALVVTGLSLSLATTALTAQAAQPVSAAPLAVTSKISPAAAGAVRPGLPDSVARDALRLSPETRAADPANAVRRLAGQGREIVVDVRTATTEWARGVAYIEAPADVHAAPQGWLFVARHSEGRWVTALEGEPEFADLVAKSPLVGTAERTTLRAFAERRTTTGRPSAQAGLAANTGLLLPWMPDYYMTVAGGPHAWDAGSGPWSSMDFSAGNASGIVRSSGSGTATSMCGAGGGWTRVIHPNGFSTDYYHMSGATYYNSTAVGRSAYLGTIGVDLCAGGSATGAHVHWALRTYDANLNGQYTSLNGRLVGGWTFYTGAAQYGGYATRLGITAYPGDAIYNRVS